MKYIKRTDQIKALFPNEPAFRIKQITKALFNRKIGSWNDMTFIAPAMRQALTEEVPFLSISEVLTQSSRNQDTFKAKIQVQGGKAVETVLMLNPRGQWTICVSSQIGCAMACSFCATGKMGLSRNLDAEEIYDQYRFWNYYLEKYPNLNQRISNIVFMGMGEPLANYPNVKETLNTLLAHTDLGKTKITVSTVGVLTSLKKILTDPEWPHVRLAISLHSANPKTRKDIVPTSFDQFLPDIKEWCIDYLHKFGNNKHHLTFEYVMLKNINDTIDHAKMLADFVNSIGHIKVNLIPYNYIGTTLECSTDDQIQKFMDELTYNGITVTKRRNMGQDISAACGQLITQKN
jgi:23S rRNA (adenine2503-C2)-methyltransferase